MKIRIEYAAPSDLIKDIKQLDKERNEALTMLEGLLK
jgi:hypothetical protein